MEDSRKLKRGLRDISPLFSEPQNAYPPQIIKETIREKKSLQLLSVFHTRYKKKSQILDFWMARHIRETGYQTGVLSLSPDSRTDSRRERPIFQEGIAHKSMTLSDFEKICSSGKTSDLLQSSLLFLNFSWLQAAFFRKVLPVLDKTVLWINADLEMLTESYRQLKWMAKQNSKTEFFIAFDGSSGTVNGSAVFEKFFEMVSRNLGIDLNWLGGCEVFSQMSEKQVDTLDWQALLQKREGSLTLSEKRGLADYLMAAS